MSAPSTNSDPAFSGSPQGSGDLGELILQVQDLRQRVLNLEERLGSAVAAPKVPVSAPPLPAAFGLPPNTVPVLGRMLVAIAGAYVLRALTDWGVLPAAAGVAIGLIYALVWLWVAARSPVEAKFAAAVSCSTSVLIMAPLVWEAAGRLKVMSSGTSSGVLAAFAVIALALGSRTQHRIIGTIAGVSSIVMAVALMLTRDDIVPFTTALLVIAAAMEFAVWRDLRPGARAFAALAADSSVLLFSYLMLSPRGMPETWIPVSPHAVITVQLALALIYIGTTISQTVVRRRTLAFAEIAQAGAALLIGIGGAAWVFKEHRAIMLGLGIAALAAGIAFYAVSFLLFERGNKWNFRALATFGLFLVLVGIFLPFSRFEFWILSCACAVACCCLARAFVLPTLGLHGAVYLLLGSAAASATSQPLSVLFAIRCRPGGMAGIHWCTSGCGRLLGSDRGNFLRRAQPLAQPDLFAGACGSCRLDHGGTGCVRHPRDVADRRRRRERQRPGGYPGDRSSYGAVAGACLGRNTLEEARVGLAAIRIHGARRLQARYTGFHQ